MFRSLASLSLSLLLLVATGCSPDGTGSPGTGDDDDDDGVGDRIFTFDDLAETDVGPGEEFYFCHFRTLDTGATAGEDVGAVRFGYTPGSPVLHHVVIFSADSTPDQSRECELLEDGWNPRYAGGTDTDDLLMPEGVAMQVDPQQTFVFQFHYANADPTETITDDTSVEIELTEPGAPFTKAALIVSGKTDFQVPAGAVDYSVNSECIVPAQLPWELNIFAIWPHMHQFGTWFTIDATIGGVEQTLWDDQWDFSDQPLARLETPLTIAANDSVRTSCLYTNPNETEPITYGESSFQEMCFDFFFYYPAIANQTFPCPFDLSD